MTTHILGIIVADNQLIALRARVDALTALNNNLARVLTDVLNSGEITNSITFACIASTLSKYERTVDNNSPTK